MTLGANWSYLWYLLRHKYFVFRAGLVLGVSLRRLLLHDMSKFSAAEWGPYVRHFYNADGSKRTMAELAQPDPAFEHAHRLHVARNDHHWDYWVHDDKPQRMDLAAVREMVADWIGAGRAVRGRYVFLEWWEKNQYVVKLHPASLARAEGLMLRFEDYLIRNEVGFDKERSRDAAADCASASMDSGRTDG